MSYTDFNVYIEINIYNNIILFPLNNTGIGAANDNLGNDEGEG